MDHGEENMDNDDILSEMETDSASDDKLDNLDPQNSQKMRSMAELARAIRNKETEIDDLESLLKEKKEQLRRQSEEDLPSMMAELGINSFELDDGSRVTVKDLYGGHISLANRDAAYLWLRDNGFDDIIKNTLSIVFGRGEDQKADHFMKILEGYGLLPEQKTGVHPSTLKGWVRERMESGDSFPMDLFGAFVGQRAVIKRSR
tara:strand:- start:38 stop:646 length:609 start_codon:yes stop_codon:yes gene_type:complete